MNDLVRGIDPGTITSFKLTYFRSDSATDLFRRMADWVETHPQYGIRGFYGNVSADWDGPADGMSWAWEGRIAFDPFGERD